ncbi:F-box/LRR-repeat protein 4 [Drosophila albomicans]|uniref:F-box/LRR-repeat protein 4 n=1 Tax=Drosophila albomicans TaxID=7291 RepID=A0A6P8XHN5_DROAB|nr:F-box/LRR-repeat protein 4 [Drosophila albomicans]XP_034098482.1 F-box/LRR-repeat protein 4 [Drosophila albomicans]
MSLLAYDGGVDDGNSSDTEPDELIDFTAMLMEQRQHGDNDGDCNDSSSWLHGDGDNKLQSQSLDNQGYCLGQYVLGVLDFSSQYGIDYSISYTAANVIGRPTKFPAYGDYPETFTMRTYGDWWQCAPSSMREIQSQNLPTLPTHDFIVVYFEKFVVPTEVAIFETFNPGGVVRIWAYNITKHWTCLWEAKSSDMIQPRTRSNYALRDSRRFAPPLKKTNVITKTLRIDFNHSQLNYYTEIDAIMLCGRTVSMRSMQQLIATASASASASAGLQRLDGGSREVTSGGPITNKLRTLKFQPSCRENYAAKLHEFINNDLSQFLIENNLEPGQQLNSSVSQTCLTDLPFEILLKILSYLDLKSLFRMGQVSRLFYDISTHPLLYGELSLKPYWQLTNSKLLCTLARRATMLRKLDLSWCGGFGEVSPTEFKKFLTQRGDNLTHLRLNSCKFLNASCIETVGIVCDNLIELSLRNCAIDPPLLNFSCLANLKNLERLDLFQTAFESELLLSMLEGNRKLKHLNLAFCGVSVNMDNVATHLGTYNTQLVSLDMWKAHFLSARGLQSLARCQHLEELDLGWCLREATLGDSLHQLLSNCPKLKKLFLSAVRGITERDLVHIATLGKNLEQLDLMGILNITHERVYDILVHCTKLQLLDLSFCDSIMDRDLDVIADWSRLFNVDIKSSRIYNAR